MLNVFMRSPLPNTLALIVLLALLITWVAAIVLGMSDKPVRTDRGLYATMLPVFAAFGLPAVIDLLQTSGVALVYAALVGIVLLLNIAIPIMRARGSQTSPIVRDWYRWSVLISALAGIAVAGYLTLSKYTGVQVSCGPAGGCDTVQNSRYATLFGVLPVAILGLAGYVGILLGWIAWQFGSGGIQKWAPVAIWAMCLFGALFSIYLTSLEPFVIGATCMWCITSAVLMVVLLLLITPAARESLAIE